MSKDLNNHSLLKHGSVRTFQRSDVHTFTRSNVLLKEGKL
jgi:hypothetical protein